MWFNSTPHTTWQEKKGLLGISGGGYLIEMSSTLLSDVARATSFITECVVHSKSNPIAGWLMAKEWGPFSCIALLPFEDELIILPKKESMDHIDIALFPNKIAWPTTMKLIIDQGYDVLGVHVLVLFNQAGLAQQPFR